MAATSLGSGVMAQRVCLPRCSASRPQKSSLASSFADAWSHVFYLLLYFAASRDHNKLLRHTPSRNCKYKYLTDESGACTSGPRGSQRTSRNTSHHRSNVRTHPRVDTHIRRPAIEAAHQEARSHTPRCVCLISRGPLCEARPRYCYSHLSGWQTSLGASRDCSQCARLERRCRIGGVSRL